MELGRATLDRQASYDHSVGSSTEPFKEKDFQLPDLEIFNGDDYETIQQVKRQRYRRKSIQFEIEKEKNLLSELDAIAQAPEETFSRKPGALERPIELKVAKGDKQAKAELAVLRHVLNRRAGEWTDEMNIIEKIIDGTYEGEDEDEHLGPPTLDHPKLGSVQEKIEDLRQESIERWCAKRGRAVNQKYTNQEKRMLRKWFEALDYDGSGEVNVEELQDPMLSSGILKTREQVVRVLANVDKNNTMGIDFEEFLLALGTNKLADQDKLKRLQQMSADPHFNTDTLIAIERRKKLIKSILKRCDERQNEVDRLYKKYDKPKLSKRERDQFHIEREALEEDHAKSVYLHLKYVTALDGVIEDKKRFYLQQIKTKESVFEDKVNELSSQDIFKTVAQIRFGGNQGLNRDEMMNKVEAAVATNGLGPARSRGTVIAMQLGMQSGTSAKPSPTPSYLTPSKDNRAAPAGQLGLGLRSSMQSLHLSTAANVLDLASTDSGSRPRASKHLATMPHVVRSHKDLVDNPYKIYAPVSSQL